MRNNFNACWAHEGETGHEEFCTYVELEELRTVLHPVTYRSWTLATGLWIQCTSQPAMMSHWGIKKGHINSFYTKDRTSSPTTQNAAVRRTAYAVRALKNLRQISHMVCTKSMVIAPFHNLFWCKCTLSCNLCFRLACAVFSDWPNSVCHSLSKKTCIFHHCVNRLTIRWTI